MHKATIYANNVRAPNRISRPTTMIKTVYHNQGGKHNKILLEYIHQIPVD